MSPTKMMSGFRLPDLLALRFTALCSAKHYTLSRAYEEALKLWCDAQEGALVVKAAEAERKKLEPPSKPEPVMFVNRRPPPEWRERGFKHGLAHIEAKRGGWKVGDPIPEGLAAPVVVSPASEEKRGNATGSEEKRGNATGSQETSQPGDFC